MSIHNNSDYEIVSNAEVSSVISKYSPDMIDMSLHEILKRKDSTSISPMGNIITSYETNLKIDMAKYPQFQNDMMERCTELYTHIMDIICAAHNISYQIPSYANICDVSRAAYQFLVSGYYQACISFFVNLFKTEAKSISRLLETEQSNINPSTIHAYASDRYNGNDDLAIIHINMNEALNAIHSMDLTLDSILRVAYMGTPMMCDADLLIGSLRDNGNFYNFYLSTIDKYRAEVVTDIRLR